MPKTFAYQLGEVRGTERASADYRRSQHNVTNVDRVAASAAAAARYCGDQHAEFVAGYRDAWLRWFDSPSFLYGAEPAAPVIVTQGQLVAALMAAFPQADEVDFHGQLADFLIEHITATN